MPLIELKPDPQTITPKIARLHVKAEISSTFARMVSGYTTLYKRAFLAHDYSPAEFFQALGQDGAEMIRTMNTLASAVEAMAPGTVKPMPPVSIDGEGNVTV